MSKYKRQFIISNKKMNLVDFEELVIKDKLILYVQKDLRIKKICSIDCVILGNAFQCDPMLENPEDEIAKVTSYDDIEEVISSWGGRWILIFKDRLYLDACGTLGCFHAVFEDKIVISSSLSLINDQFSTMKYEETISYKYGMDWFPGPLTNLHNVFRLMPSQYIIFSNEQYEVKTRDILNMNLLQSLTTAEKIEKFNLLLSTFLKNVEKEFSYRIYLPLTAGFDSRTILSSCLINNIKFISFTQQHSNISKSDVEIPKKLAEDFKFEHIYIKREKRICKNKLKEFDSHVFNNSVDADRYFYSYNQWEQFEKGGIVLRGGLWEITREFYHKIPDTEDKSRRLELITNYFINIPKSNLHKRAIECWLEHIDSYNNDINWRDKLYIEQRVGGWMSSIENGLDITNVERVHPINCQKMLSLLYSIDVDERLNGNHQKLIIEYNNALLLNYPFNKKCIKDILNRYIKGGLRTLKNEGLSGIINVLRKKF